ncbi:MAG TPA: type II secretion system protein GspC [Gammaproteobacteria bacterium]|nr:type II secretion system protein GspC [Gammaproteobacteria bacterium]
MTNHIARLARQLNAKAWDRLALVVSLLLILLLAHALARLTWAVLPAPEQALPPPPAAAPAAQARADYRQLAALHLFGQAVQTNTPGGAPIDAPETRLNLTLRGILFNTSPELTRAIISAPGRDDEIYRTGAQVPGGAVIDQIYADRVMLLRNGQYEALRLPEESITAATPRSAATPGQVRPRQQAAASGLAGIRQDIVANPQNVANYIQGEPVNRAGGGIVGFRVFPGQNRAVFEQSDLREGDIITNVNGIQLDGLDKAAEAMAQLASANAVTVTVLRDGAEHTLQIQLQN